MSLDESLSDNISSISSQKEKIIRTTSHGSCYTRCFGHTPERCSNANCFLWSFQVFRGPIVALGDSPLLSFKCRSEPHPRRHAWNGTRDCITNLVVFVSVAKICVDRCQKEYFFWRKGTFWAYFTFGIASMQLQALTFSILLFSCSVVSNSL